MEESSTILQKENLTNRTKSDDNFSVRNSLSEDINKFIYSFKLNMRFLKKQIRKYINNKTNKKFINIVYLTADCPQYIPKCNKLDSPIDYITEMRKQYPETNFCLLIPLLGINEDFKLTKKHSLDIDNNFFDIEKTSMSFNFYAQNKNWDCLVYKFQKNESNIPVYGIYSTAFSHLKNPEEIKVFDKAILFMKAARIVIKNLDRNGFKPDIVHAELLPFFLGAEFEPKFPTNIKIFQVFENFIKLENDKQEPFWSALNIADKRTMTKIYKDNTIQNNVSRLFNLPIREITPKMEDCINLIYDNYKIFHNPNSENFENKGDIIFRQLNSRIQKIIPGLIEKDENFFYPFLNTLINCDFWSVYSETYYDELYKNKLATSRIMKEIIRTSNNSGFIRPVVKIRQDEQNNKIYNNFNNENYREERQKNKKKLLKEFSSDSIKTKFIDETLFKNIENTTICGYLDSFYEAPLLFANPETDIFNEGTDILFNTLLKLFERNRNIQIIISIKNGMNNSYIKSVIDFLKNNHIFMGRWIFIDGEVNLPKMFSASDIFLYPARLCDSSVKHLLGYQYGCIPVVSNAGILNDTVLDILDNIAEGNGFKTKQSLLYEKEDTNIYINCLEKALELYNNNHSGWNRLIKNNLTTNTGWDFDKLEHYYQIYQNLL